MQGIERSESSRFHRDSEKSNARKIGERLPSPTGRRWLRCQSETDEGLPRRHREAIQLTTCQTIQPTTLVVGNGTSCPDKSGLSPLLRGTNRANAMSEIGGRKGNIMRNSLMKRSEIDFEEKTQKMLTQIIIIQ